MSSRETDLAIVDKAIQLLGEHFDSVQVFTSRYEPTLEDGTVSVRKGNGDWYSRFGQVKEWVIKEEERMRQQVRGEVEP
jgi:uncharacterized Zn finger protein